MIDPVVLPWVELVCIDWLLSVDVVTDLVDDRVSTRSPENVIVPYVLLHRIGGLPVEPRWFDAARIQVGSWGASEAEASEVGRSVFAALIAMRGFEHPTAQVADVRPVLGLSWNPDTSRTNPTPRFTFDVAVYLHPALNTAS